MKKIRIAQIGTEHDHATPMMQTFLSLSDIFEVVGYAFTEEELNGIHQNMYSGGKGAYKDVKLYTIQELLDMDDLDAVAIEAEDMYLVKYATMFAKKGVHVHMDKPGSQSVEDFEEMLSYMKKSGKIFSIGYMYRHNPAVKNLLERIEKGEFGEIYSVEAHMSRNDQVWKRKWLGDYKGGMNFFLGSHLVDLIVQIQGIPEYVLPLNCSTHLDDVHNEDYGMAVLKYKNGVSFEKSCASERGGFSRRQLVICGSKGTAEIRPLEGPAEGMHMCSNNIIEAIAPDNDLCAWTVPYKSGGEFKFHRYANMAIDFANRINANDQGKYTLEYEARVHRIILCASGIECDYKCEINL